MRVLVVSGRTARQPWAAGGLVARVCRALATKGHRLTLAAQSVDDAALFTSCEAVHAFDSFDQTATDWPLGFAAWAGRQRREVSHEVCVSFSRSVGGDVWMPLEPSGASWLTRARRTHSIKSLAIALGRHHGALRGWASDAFFAAPRDGTDLPIRRVIAVGATSAGEASRALHRVRGLGERVVRVDPFAGVDPPGREAMMDLRERTRALLKIGSERRVVLVSVPHAVGTTLDGLLSAAGEAGSRDPQRGPLLLALTKDCFALHARAIRRGAASHARIVGLTDRMDGALAAADAVALAHKADRGVFESGGMGRLGAEAMRFGRPILALSGAPGYGLARLRSTQQDSPGLVVDYPTAEAWSRALRQIGDDAWLERAGAAALQLGVPMRVDRFVDRLENVLTEAATERAEELGRK